MNRPIVTGDTGGRQFSKGSAKELSITSLIQPIAIQYERIDDY